MREDVGRAVRAVAARRPPHTSPSKPLSEQGADVIRGRGGPTDGVVTDSGKHLARDVVA